MSLGAVPKPHSTDFKAIIEIIHRYSDIAFCGLAYLTKYNHLKVLTLRILSVP